MNLIGTTLALALLTAAPSAPDRSVDGFVVHHLPPGAGERVTEFAYEWEDVGFRSQVWERGPDPAGAHAVDLTVKVLRGTRLTDLAATAAFLAEYHEQDPADWSPFDHYGEPGLRRPDAVFWWAGPGLAVEVSLDGTRFPDAELTATALGVRREQDVRRPSRGSPAGCTTAGQPGTPRPDPATSHPEHRPPTPSAPCEVTARCAR